MARSIVELRLLFWYVVWSTRGRLGLKSKPRSYEMPILPPIFIRSFAIEQFVSRCCDANTLRKGMAEVTLHLQ